MENLLNKRELRDGLKLILIKKQNQMKLATKAESIQSYVKFVQLECTANFNELGYYVPQLKEKGRGLIFLADNFFIWSIKFDADALLLKLAKQNKVNKRWKQI